MLTDPAVLLYLGCSPELSTEGVRRGCCGVGVPWGAEHGVAAQAERCQPGPE